MQHDTDLTTYLPPGLRDPAADGPGRLAGPADLRSPFVFPWSALRRMTGVVVADGSVTLARGRLDGHLFHVDGVAVHSRGVEGAPPLPSLGPEPVCVCLPRAQTLVRHFRVPAETDAEIDAMLPHLLTGELPMALDRFSWVWTVLPTADEDTTLVAVYVARNERLREFLAPLVEADLNIVGLIPESWCWLQALREVAGQDADEDPSAIRSFLVRNHESHQLVVARDGQLLFDMALPLSTSPDPETLDWEGSGFTEARRAFADLMGAPLPPPEIWPAALDSEDFCFAASVAAAGLERRRLMAPLDLRQRARRRTTRGAVAGLGWLAGLAVLVWAALAAVDDTRTRSYLAELEAKIAEDAPTVEQLEVEYNAVRESNRERAGNTEVLQILNNLRHHVDPPVYLAHLNYVQGRGVSLRGGAPSSRHVLEMTETLDQDPLWEALRVMQLRSEMARGTEQVHFVIEGQVNR